MISVLLVDDSAIAILVLQKMLLPFTDIEVVGTANNGEDALALIPKLQPRVICTDLHMPKMDGLQFIKEVMKRHPLPILVISVSVHQSKDDHNIFELLDAGAIDVFPKPRGGLDSFNKELTVELASKIRVLSGVIPIRRHNRGKSSVSVAPPVDPRPSRTYPKIVVMGASTGGPQALMTILSELPKHFPVPVLCVQHISAGFLDEMVSWLGGTTSLTVRVAKPGETLQAGFVYFPEEGSHLVFNTQGRVGAQANTAEELHCPSIDIAFSSVAACFQEAVVGVLLTGMGRDGAQGLRAILDAGGTTIAQDEASSVVFGMPQQAIALGGAKEILPLSDIASALMRHVGW
ncbi:MAG: chemotaxis-specific protein-glutamate methyltransferase CheB [Magnetococcus sp. YQC-5]